MGSHLCINARHSDQQKDRQNAGHNCPILQQGKGPQGPGLGSLDDRGGESIPSLGVWGRLDPPHKKFFFFEKKNFSLKKSKKRIT